MQSTSNFSTLIRNVVFCLSLTIMLQLLFTINLTEQKSLGESSSSSGKHLQFNQDAINDNRDVDGYKSPEQPKNRLALTPEMIYWLMKRYQKNRELQEYLQSELKAKKNEAYLEDEDEDAYEGKFRF